MRCRYCGGKIHPTDLVCKGCSAPVPTVNHAAGWAVFFAVLSLLLSVLSVYNGAVLLLGLIFLFNGFRLAKKRDGKGRVPSRIALAFWILGLLATIAVSVFYILRFDDVVHTLYVLFPSVVSERFEEWFWFFRSVVGQL